jgi:hypothetical protein
VQVDAKMAVQKNWSTRSLSAVGNVLAPGRKPNLTKILLKGVSRETIVAACENVDIGAVIIGLPRSKCEQSRIEAAAFHV